MEDLTRLIEALPTHARAHLERSRSYRELGDLERAEADYRRAIGLDPSLATAAEKRG